MDLVLGAIFYFCFGADWTFGLERVNVRHLDNKDYCDILFNCFYINIARLVHVFNFKQRFQTCTVYARVNKFRISGDCIKIISFLRMNSFRKNVQKSCNIFI